MHKTWIYHPKLAITDDKLRTPASTMAMIMGNVECHHLAFGDDVIGVVALVPFAWSCKEFYNNLQNITNKKHVKWTLESRSLECNWHFTTNTVFISLSYFKKERRSSLIKLRNEVCVFWGYHGISMINWSMEDGIAEAKFLLHKK